MWIKKALVIVGWNCMMMATLKLPLAELMT
jgi:hypothetical protein